MHPSEFDGNINTSQRKSHKNQDTLNPIKLKLLKKKKITPDTCQFDTSTIFLIYLFIYLKKNQRH